MARTSQKEGTTATRTLTAARAFGWPTSRPNDGDERAKILRVERLDATRDFASPDVLFRTVRRGLEMAPRAARPIEGGDGELISVPFHHLVIAGPDSGPEPDLVQLADMLQSELGQFLEPGRRFEVRAVRDRSLASWTLMFGYGVHVPGDGAARVGTVEVSLAPEPGRPPIGETRDLLLAGAVPGTLADHVPAALYRGQIGVVFAAGPNLAPALSDAMRAFRGGADPAADGILRTAFYLGRLPGSPLNSGRSRSLRFEALGSAANRYALAQPPAHAGAMQSADLIDREGEWIGIEADGRPRPVFHIRFTAGLGSARFHRAPPRDAAGGAALPHAVVLGIRLPDPRAWRGEIGRVWVRFTHGGHIAHCDLALPVRTLVIGANGAVRVYDELSQRYDRGDADFGLELQTADQKTVTYRFKPDPKSRTVLLEKFDNDGQRLPIGYMPTAGAFRPGAPGPGGPGDRAAFAREALDHAVSIELTRTTSRAGGATRHLGLATWAAVDLDTAFPLVEVG